MFLFYLNSFNTKVRLLKSDSLARTLFYIKLSLFFIRLSQLYRSSKMLCKGKILQARIMHKSKIRYIFFVKNNLNFKIDGYFKNIYTKSY